jgi:hypothetical protein
MTDIAELVNVLTRWDQRPSAHDCSRAASALEAQAAEIERLRADVERLKGLLDVYRADCAALREARRLGR